MMRKWILTATAATLAVLLLCGCGKSTEPSDQTHAGIPLSELMSEKGTSSLSSDPEVEQPSSNELSANEGDIVLKMPSVAFEEPTPGDWSLVLVNAITPIDEDYEMTLANITPDYLVDERIMAPLQAMMQAAEQDGVSIFPCSAYRSVERSAYLFERQVQQYLDRGYSKEEAEIIAAHWVAPPGTSEHHTGLTLDFLSNESTTMNETFARTEAAQWLLENAESYGFILRYPKGKEQITGIVFEPWHYRYVGVRAAAEIMQNGLTLEEYLGADFVGYEDIEVD